MPNGLARVFYVRAFFFFNFIKSQVCVTLDFGFCFVLFSILKIVLIFYETYWELEKSAAFLSLKSLFLEGFRKQELFKFLVFFSMRKDLSSLVYHVEI